MKLVPTTELLAPIRSMRRYGTHKETDARTRRDTGSRSLSAIFSVSKSQGEDLFLPIAGKNGVVFQPFYGGDDEKQSQDAARYELMWVQNKKMSMTEAFS
eukprot:7116831-Alexandrium_andersonii.AAC.1